MGAIVRTASRPVCMHKCRDDRIVVIGRGSALRLLPPWGLQSMSKSLLASFWEILLLATNSSTFFVPCSHVIEVERALSMKSDSALKPSFVPLNPLNTSFIAAGSKYSLADVSEFFVISCDLFGSRFNPVKF